MLLTRRGLLASSVAACTVGLVPKARAQAAGPDYFVFVFAEGGWDVSYCFDPKLQSDWVDGPEVDQDPSNAADVDEIQTFGEMPIVVNPVRRPAVGAFFEKWWDRTAVVNGISIGSIAHQASRVRLFTGTTSASSPDMTAIVGSARGGDRPLGSVDLSSVGITGKLAPSTGRVGQTSQLEALVDSTSLFEPPSGAGYTLPLFRPDEVSEELVRAYLQKREAQLRAERATTLLGAESVLDDYLESLDRRQKLLEKAAPLSAGLTLGAAPALIDQLDLATELFRQDVCQSVLVKHAGFDWDTHTDNSLQDLGYEELFAQLDLFLAALEADGLLDRTLVVVASEFTRSPQLNWLGGKDHWSYTSAMLIGAGVQGGRTYGGTDDYVEALPVDLETGAVHEAGSTLNYPSFVAGILERMSADPVPWVGSAAPFRAPFV